MSMLWHKFTEKAKRSVIAAQDTAVSQGEPYVCPEHLLLGLIQEGSNVATCILERLGLSLTMLHDELASRMRTGGCSHLTANDVTLDPRIKRVLDFAYDEARQANNNYIGTEHLLLGILREGDGLAYDTLKRLGINHVATRMEAVAYLGGTQAAPSLAASPVPRCPTPSAPPAQPVLYQVQRFADPDSATTWLNANARQGFRFADSTATPTGELWIIVRALDPPTDQSASHDEHD